VVIGTRRFGEHRGPDPVRYRRRRLYFESGSEQEVKVRFSGPGAGLARERWPAAAANADGSATVTARLALGNYLFGWVLGWGGQAEIESPAAAREQLRARVMELERMYGG